MSGTECWRQHGSQPGVGGLAFSPLAARTSNNTTRTLRRWPRSHPSRTQPGYRAEAVRRRPSSPLQRVGWVWCREIRAGTRVRPAQGQPASWVWGCYGSTARADQTGGSWSLGLVSSWLHGLYSWEHIALTANTLGQPVLPPPEADPSAALQKSAPPCPSLQGRSVTRPRTRLCKLGIPPSPALAGTETWRESGKEP